MRGKIVHGQPVASVSWRNVIWIHTLRPKLHKRRLSRDLWHQSDLPRRGTGRKGERERHRFSFAINDDFHLMTGNGQPRDI